MASPRKSKTAVTTETPVSAGPVVTLDQVIAATQAGDFVYTSPAFHAELVASGQVEINPEMTDEHGNIATRAITPTESKPQMTETVTASPKSVYTIESDVAIPPKAPRVSTGLRAGRTPVYPFEQLEINQSFFVADKAADKPAVKALASTVAGANARFTEAVEGQTRTNRKGNVVPVTKQLRKFKLFASEKTAEDGTVIKGARVFRIALDEAAE